MSLLQNIRLVFRPYGLKAHQLRPQDIGERTLDDLFGNASQYIVPDNVEVINGGKSNKGYQQELGYTSPGSHPPPYSHVQSANYGNENPSYQHEGSITKL